MMLVAAALQAHAAAGPSQAAPGVGVGLDCWTFGFTRGHCCNKAFGDRGNPHCWGGAGDMFTFESCCGGRSYEPRGCGDFVTHFPWSALQMDNALWERCVDAMEHRRQDCNGGNTSWRSCPECAAISPHLITYIRCVRQEQERPQPRTVCPACCQSQGDAPAPEPLGGGTQVFVGGTHFPTLVRPRYPGRDFSVLASAFDTTVGYAMISEGRWMPQETALLQEFLPVGGVAVDAGANIGGFLLPLARHVGPDGQVHAFEPFRAIYQILTANCALNGLMSCYTYHAALGNQTERKRKPMPGLNAVSNPSKSFVVDSVASEMMVHHDGHGRTEEVEVVRLDDKLRLPRLDVLKIDVESMEYELLLGAHETIATHGPVIYLEDSEADMATMTTMTRSMQLLSDHHNYACLNLAQSGLHDMSSLLCAPSSRMDEVRRRLRHIDFNFGHDR